MGWDDDRGRQRSHSASKLQRPGILDSLSARPLARTPPGPNEVEIEVAATGLNFKDLMMAMGMLPKEAMADGSEGGRLLGLECAGRVVAVGDNVSEFAVGDEVLAGGLRALATHLTVDARYRGAQAALTSASSRRRRFRSPS